MNDIIKENRSRTVERKRTGINVGDTVKVYAKIKEGNRERIQVLKEQS